MRVTIPSVAAAVLAAALLAGCERGAGTGQPDTTTVLYAVEGMSCTGCEDAICTEVKGVDGVFECVASHEQGIVKVILVDAARTGDVTTAINDLGYTATLEE